MEPRFESSTKNKPLLVLNNFRYTHYNTNKHQGSHWRCVHYHKGCRAQIKTYNNKIVNSSTPIHNHGLASPATTSRAHPVSASTPKAKTNLNRKIAILQKLLNAKSSDNKALNKTSSEEISNSSKDSSNEDISDSSKNSSYEHESDSNKHSSNENESDFNKHSSNENESDSSKQSFSKMKQNHPYMHSKIFNKNKKPIKWVKY